MVLPVREEWFDHGGDFLFDLPFAGIFPFSVGSGRSSGDPAEYTGKMKAVHKAQEICDLVDTVLLF